MLTIVASGHGRAVSSGTSGPMFPSTVANREIGAADAKALSRHSAELIVNCVVRRIGRFREEDARHGAAP